jgi:hypothetical protein
MDTLGLLNVLVDLLWWMCEHEWTHGPRRWWDV